MSILRRPFAARLRQLHSLLALLLLLCSTAIADSDDDAKRKAQQLERKIANIQASLTKDRQQESKALKALRTTEKQLGNTERTIRDHESELKTLRAELNSLNTQQNLLQSQAKQQQSLIAEQIREAYKLGRQRKLKLLLNQEEPENLQRTLRYYDYLNVARSEAMESFRLTVEELEALKPQLVKRRIAIEAGQAALNAQQQQLSKQLSQRKSSLASLRKEMSSQGKSLERYLAERKELQKVLQALEQELANIRLPDSYRPFRSQKGKLSWPIQGRQSNRYGGKKGDSGLRWTGVKLRGKSGKDVKAIHHGRVIYADWLRGAGLLIVVDHGDGYMSLYGHNQSLLQSVGDWVAPGDSIATVGNSGGQQQAALYFEIRHKGKPLDPNSWCARS